MTAAKYMMISTVACSPDYLDEAHGHLAGVKAALREALPSVGVRFGTFLTGVHSGSLAFFHSYRDMADIEPAFGVWAASEDFRALSASGQISLTERDLVMLEELDLPVPSAETPGYGVLTRAAMPVETRETVRRLMPVLGDNGAMTARFGTQLTGTGAGRQVLGVSYSSMDAIERAYDALGDSPAWRELLAGINLDSRDIVRFAP